MARRTVDRALADRKLAKKKRDKRLSSLPYVSRSEEREHETVDKTLRKRRTPKKPKKAIIPRTYKKAGTKPKAKHPGKAFPKPKGKAVPKGRGRRVPKQGRYDRG